MCAALYTKASSAGNADCPFRHTLDDQWLQELPAPLTRLVVAPVSFEVAQDYELQADSTHGRDAAHRPCFSEFRFVLTQLRSDDDEVFYEQPVYAESRTSWRLIDERWLTCRTTVARFDDAVIESSFAVSDVMPR
jgi:hypothetical protein